MPFRPAEAAREEKAKARQAGKQGLVVTRGRQQEPPPPPGAFSWRYAVGAFEVKIPVTTGEKMLPQEENTLAIMKWRLQQMLPSNRWYPVLQQYIAYCADRIAGLGGDPNSIPPSVNGAPIKVITGKEPTVSYTGKVCEIIYDCFGDFEGFVLDSCCGEKRRFKSCERTLGELVLRACIDRLTLTVVVDRKNGDRICRIMICC
jgi:hypothetical protein